MITEIIGKHDRSIVGYLDADAETPSKGDYIHIYVKGTPKNLMVETRFFFYDNENQLNKVQLVCFDPTANDAKF